MKQHIIKNSLIRYCVYGFFFVSILGTLSHFFYDWSVQNPIVGFFCPVSESTWEHMKLVFFPMLLYYPFVYKKLGTAYPLVSSVYPWSILLGTHVVPIMFYTYSGILGFQIMFVDILIFYASVLLAFLFFYYLTKDYPAPFKCQNYEQKHPKRNKCFLKLKPLLNLLVVITICLFIIFTNHPPKLAIFQSP